MSDENLADPGINPSLWINIVMPQCPPSSIQETLPWWHNSRTMQTASSEANKPPRAAVIELEYSCWKVECPDSSYPLWVIIHWHSILAVLSLSGHHWWIDIPLVPRNQRCLRSLDDEKQRAADTPVRRQWFAIHLGNHYCYHSTIPGSPYVPMVYTSVGQKKLDITSYHKS